MQKVISLVRSPLFLAFIGACAVAALLWFLIPLAGVENDYIALAVACLPFPAWGGYVFYDRRRRSAAEASLAQGLYDETQAAVEEEQAVRQRFRDAVERLRKIGGDRVRLQDMPWYVLIGPPASGKTTALINSGLRYPLEAEFGRGAVKGAGGTRLCDWWFTDEAVLIDTAGRFTTRDDNAAVDKAGWDQFLNLLAEHRPQQPLNGIFLALGIDELLDGDARRRESSVAAVRRRLQEITERFGQRFPVYVLVTKTDLVAGFDEFFRNLNAAQREQALGMTFPLAEDDVQENFAARFEKEFDLIAGRIRERLLDRMQEEDNPARRARIFAFPAEFSTVRDAVAGYLKEIFATSKFESAIWLRGVYFTSGTQSGTPVARLMNSLAAGFGLQRLNLPAFSTAGRSYFITQALRDVAFREAGLAGFNPGAESRARIIRGVSFAALGAVLLSGGGAWTAAYLQNAGLIDRFDDEVKSRMAALNGLPADVADGDLRALLPILDAVRAMPAGYDAARSNEGRPLDLGLGRFNDLAFTAKNLYHRALIERFIPRLVYRAYAGLNELTAPGRDVGPAAAERIETTLTVLLRLAGQEQGAPKPESVQAWLREQLTAEGYTANEIASAERHFIAATAERLQRTEFPGHAVERARAVLRDVGPAVRGYAAVLRAGEAARLPPWRVADQGGNETHRVFIRKSQARLTEGVPGLFTKAGFYGAVAPQVLIAAQSIRENAWILDQNAGQTQIPPTLEKDILNLYFKDYARHWEELLDDLALADAPDLRRQADLTGVMAGRESPLAKLLRAVTAETSLTGGGLSPAAQLLTAHSGWAATAAAAKSEVDDRFALLANFAGPSPSRLDNLIKALEAVHSDLLRLSKTSGPERPDTPAAQMLINETLQAPYPVKNWIETLAARITANAVNSARDKLNADWRSTVLPWCGRVVEGRYPFTSAGAEASMEDFGRLFAPGGVLDAFFDSHLRSYVDTSAPTWRWRMGDGQDLGIAPSTAGMFQTAARIRDAFFAGGGKEPRAVFDVKLSRLVGGGQQVELTVDGRAVSFVAGAPNAQQIIWPGSGGARQVLAVFPPPPSLPPVAAAPTAGATPLPLPSATALPPPPPAVNRDGPWAFYRLLRAGSPRGRDGGRFSFSLGVGGVGAAFDVVAGSSLNPLTVVKDLEEFRCPARL